uniref:O-fucosyltransferase family protein n=2 Tax=Spongospora subterranea TaxID=70186 RepID=A0A0H5R8B1_9EUKA|eukprot:CRZ09942.1 hypothetical protein [Spongospora subterranea]
MCEAVRQANFPMTWWGSRVLRRSPLSQRPTDKSERLHSTVLHGTSTSPPNSPFHMTDFGNDHRITPIFTWRTGRFGRFGNQKLMLLYAHALSRETGWMFIPPPMSIECGDASYLYEFTDLFSPISLLGVAVLEPINDQESLELPEVAISPSLPDDETVMNALLMENAKFKGRCVFRIEENLLWEWGTSLYGISWLQSAPMIANAATAFTTPSIKWQPFFWQLLQKYDIQSAIGVHLRGEDFKQHCSSLEYLFLPSSYIYKCHMDDPALIIRAISAVESNRPASRRAQPLFIASNLEQKSPVLTDLRNFYGQRLINLNDSDWTTEQKRMRPYIDSMLLSHSGDFIGSRMSTFSTVIAAERSWNNVSFVELAHPLVLPIFLLFVIIVIASFFLRGYKRFSRGLICVLCISWFISWRTVLPFVLPTGVIVRCTRFFFYNNRNNPELSAWLFVTMFEALAVIMLLTVVFRKFCLRRWYQPLPDDLPIAVDNKS